MMHKKIKSLVWDSCGQGLVGYALVVGFITVGAVAVLPGVAVEVAALLNRVLGSGGVLSWPNAELIRIVCGVLMCLFLGWIVLRRKKMVK